MARKVFSRVSAGVSEGYITLRRLFPSVMLRTRVDEETREIAVKRSEKLSSWLEQHLDSENHLDIRRIGRCVDKLVADTKNSGLEEGALVSTVKSINEIQLTDRINAPSATSGVFEFTDFELLVGDIHTHPIATGPSALDILGVAVEHGRALSMVAHEGGTYALIKDSGVPLDASFTQTLTIQAKVIYLDAIVGLREVEGVVCQRLSAKLQKVPVISDFLEKRGAHLGKQSKRDLAQFCNKLGVRVFYQDKDVPQEERYKLAELKA